MLGKVFLKAIWYIGQYSGFVALMIQILASVSLLAV